MPDKPIPGTSSESLDDLPRAASNSDALRGPRADLARVIPRRRRVTLAITIGLAVGFGVLITPTITAERVFVALGAGHVAVGQVAKMTVRVPPFAGYDTRVGRIGGTGGVVIARGDVATRDDVIRVLALDDALPRGPVPYLAYFLLVAVLAGLASHHLRRSNRGRLVRVQLVNLALIALAAIGIKALMLTTAVSVLVVPVALFAIVPTLALDRVTGLATGVLAALVVSLIVPFDVAVAIVLLAQVATAGLVVAEKPKSHLRAALTAGGAATLLTAVTYPLLMYLTTGALPIAELRDPLHSAWLAAALGPAIATVLAMPMLPLYQLAVGEITHGKLVELEDLSHPLLRQISEKAPGTWQHSLMMANMAEIAANAIGANGRLVRVGAYFHDLGKSLQPKYFIENLEPGEPSPHDRLAPEASCDAIFAHVTEGIVTARKSGLHERVIDFMHMHHGNGLLEYFWAKCREQGNPRELSVEHFRYPGVPPQSRETAILAICDAVEAASRTLKKPDPGAIDQLVQRIVYGKLHLGQLDESGLSMGDLRRVSDSLRETIRHANHGRIEYPWQKAQQSASAAASLEPLTSTGPRLDSLDGPGRPGRKPTSTPPPVRETRDALADTADVVATPRLRIGAESSATGIEATAPVERASAKVIESSRDVRTVVGRAAPDQSIAPPPKLPAAAPPPDEPSPSRDASSAQAWRAADAGVTFQGRPRPSTSELAPARPSTSELAPVRPPTAEPARPRPSTAELVPPPPAKVFAEEAAQVLRETSKEIAILPREAIPTPIDPEPAAPPAPAPVPTETVRKRAATLPPIAPRRAPTINPPIVAKSDPKVTLPGATARAPTAPPMKPIPSLPALPVPPLPVPPARPPAFPETVAGVAAKRPTDPPPPKPQAEIVDEPDDEVVRITAPRPVELVDDAGTTKPRLERLRTDKTAEPPTEAVDELTDDEADTEEPDDTQPRMPLPLPAPAVSDPGIAVPPVRDSGWARGLAHRIDAALEDEFGVDTPTRAPTHAELQALLNSPPDPTRKQSLEEIEALHRESRRSGQEAGPPGSVTRGRRRSEPDVHAQLTRRAPYPTAEVDESDIEAAIELAPPARRTAIGVAKKKPTE